MRVIVFAHVEGEPRNERFARFYTLADARAELRRVAHGLGRPVVAYIARDRWDGSLDHPTARILAGEEWYSVETTRPGVVA